MVLLDNVTIPVADGHVYVPAGGMSPDWRNACMNDHFFLCPRHLCPPYFKLLELFDHDECLAPVSLHLANNTLPAPPTSSLSQQWYFYLAYGGQWPHCQKYKKPAQCCGRLRELRLFYTIARGRSATHPPSLCGYLECTKRLKWTWRLSLNSSFEHIDRQVMPRCRQLSRSLRPAAAAGTGRDTRREACTIR